MDIIFMKLGISSQGLHDFVFTRLHSMKYGRHKYYKSKTGGETHVRTNFGKVTSFVPTFLFVFVLTFDFILNFVKPRVPSTLLSKLEPSTFRLLHFTYFPMKEGCLFVCFV
jgi:hypothetical protein